MISDRSKSFPISATRKLIPFAVEAKKAGKKVYHLNIGDPDIKTPEEILAPLKTWSDNPIRYTRSQGEEAFIEALKWYYHKLGYAYLENENIIATIGGSEAILMTFYTVANPGEEILVFEPFYSNYSGCADFAGIKLSAVPTSISEGFHLPIAAQIEKYITPKTKAIFITNPGNPTGTVYTQEEIEMLIDIAMRHKIFLISDEVYREFNFTDRRFISLLDYMQDLPEQLIVLDSLSKRYSLCGARLGNVVSQNIELMDAIGKLTLMRLSGGYIDQKIGSELTKVKDSYFDAMKEEYIKRRDVIYNELSSIDGVEIAVPEGAFYSMVKLPVESSEEFAKWLLSEFDVDGETVMVAPGEGFYATDGAGVSEIRIAYVLNVEDLKKAMNIIKQGLRNYKG